METGQHNSVEANSTTGKKSKLPPRSEPWAKDSWRIRLWISGCGLMQARKPQKSLTILQKLNLCVSYLMLCGVIVLGLILR
jgi:hypothetical protein